MRSFLLARRPEQVAQVAAGMLDPGDFGNLSPILEAVEAETSIFDGRNSSNREFVDRVAALNVHRTVLDLLDRSPALARLVSSGNIGLVAAMYDVETGRVEVIETSWSDHG